MTPTRILLILLLIAIIGFMAYALLGPTVRAITSKPSLGDVAVNYAQTQLSQPTPTAGTPPPSVAEVAATMAAIPINAEGTRQAVQSTEEARAAGTQEAQNRQATATSDYWRSLYWSATVTAAYDQTQTAYPPQATAYSQTQTALPLYATAEAGRVHAEETKVAGSAIRSSQGVNMDQWAIPIGKIVSFVVVLGALFLIGIYIFQMKRVRRLTPDGKVNLIEDKNGEFHQTHADRMPTSAMKIGTNGTEIEADADYQEKVTTQAQLVQAVEAAAMAQNPQQAFNVADTILNGNAPRYTLEEPPMALLSPEVEKDLDLEWEEGKNG